MKIEIVHTSVSVTDVLIPMNSHVVLFNNYVDISDEANNELNEFARHLKSQGFERVQGGFEFKGRFITRFSPSTRKVLYRDEQEEFADFDPFSFKDVDESKYLTGQSKAVKEAIELAKQKADFAKKAWENMSTSTRQLIADLRKDEE